MKKAEEERKTKMRSEVMLEYLKGLEVRFVPFRRYHMLTSEHDLVWNGIASSEHNVINAVDVAWYDEGKARWQPKNHPPGQPAGSTQIKAHSSIPEDMIRMKSVNYLNCKGYSMSLRYGMGSLIYGMKQMYRGEILTLGNPRIQPWDICTIIDSYNDMTGPVEVEAVTHMFSHETGYLTEIKPNALVIGNEISSWPVLEALKMVQMAVVLQGQEKSGNLIGDSDINAAARNRETALLSGQVDPFLTGIPTGMFKWGEFDKVNEVYMAERYKEIMGQGYPIERLQNPTGPALFNEDAHGAGSLKSNMGVAVAGLLAYAVLRRAGGMAAAWRASKQTVGAPKSSHWISQTMKALFIGGTAGKIGTDTVAAFNVLDFKRGGSISWFIAAPIIFAKCMEQEAVIVVPLVKAGRPIVSGLTLKDPMMLWKNVAGNIRNVAEDTVTGVTDYVAELNDDFSNLYEILMNDKTADGRGSWLTGPWIGNTGDN
jgi:hypothetical protein